MKLKEKNKLICIFGPDGSGKSALTKKIKKNKKNSNITFYHWRPRILPPFKKKIIKKKFINNINNGRNYFFSFFLYIYYFLDFKLFEFFFLKKKYNSKLFIFERYYYDILVHPRRYNLRKINWLGFYLSKKLAKPKFSVLLSGNPKIIYNRKKELSLSDIKKQIITYKKILPKFSKTYVYNTTKIKLPVLIYLLMSKIFK